MRYRYVFSRDPNHWDMIRPAQCRESVEPRPPLKDDGTIAIDVELSDPLGPHAADLAFAEVQRAFPGDVFLLKPPTP